jgi:hypothetical protein
MFEFTESISILAPPPAVWEFLRDVEGWWPASNPEHDSIERLDDRDVLEVGAQLRIREKVAGIPGVATGTITRVAPGSAITWEAPEARYKWFGLSFTVGEGVTWRVEPGDDDKSAIVSAHVWATFPPGVPGRLLEFGFRMLGGVEKDREHARVELRYLKRVIEALPR